MSTGQIVRESVDVDRMMRAWATTEDGHPVCRVVRQGHVCVLPDGHAKDQHLWVPLEVGEARMEMCVRKGYCNL